LRNGSLSSVEVIFLDNAAAVEKLENAAKALKKEDRNVLFISLFGSLAEGTATPESDADVIVVVREAEERFIDRGDEYREYFNEAGLDIAVELFVYQLDEFKRMAESGNDFIGEIIKTGVLLAGE